MRLERGSSWWTPEEEEEEEEEGVSQLVADLKGHKGYRFILVWAAAFPAESCFGIIKWKT